MIKRLVALTILVDAATLVIWPDRYGMMAMNPRNNAPPHVIRKITRMR